MFSLVQLRGDTSSNYKLDMAEPGQIGFQNIGSYGMEEVVFFHDEIMYFITLIIVFVLWLIVRALSTRLYNRYLYEGVTIETIWTLIPAVILILIAFPSLKLLYMMDEVLSPRITIKVIGQQWYWVYEYSDYQPGITFDSYMIATSDLDMDNIRPRLLAVDNPFKVPVQTEIRLLVTGGDVLHSFAIPSMGIKVDAVPGRLNQMGFIAKRHGVFFGQCSEICGANHSFMPIQLEVVSMEDYIS